MATKPDYTRHITQRQLILEIESTIEGVEVTRKPVSEAPKGKSFVTVVEETRTIPNANELRDAEEFVKRATEAIQALAIQGPGGLLGDYEDKAKIVKDIRKFNAERDAINAKAKHIQVKWDVYMFTLETVADRQTVTMIAERIRTSLEGLRDSLGDTDKARTEFAKVRDLAPMAVGVQSDAVRYALEQAKACILGTRAWSQKHDAIENAITLFAPADEAKIPEL